jgi:hypothetical protein
MALDFTYTVYYTDGWVQTKNTGIASRLMKDGLYLDNKGNLVDGCTVFWTLWLPPNQIEKIVREVGMK